MDVTKIGLTIFLIKESQVAYFRRNVLDVHSGPIPLNSPLGGVFLPFSSASGIPIWVNAVGALLIRQITFDMSAKSPSGLLVVEEDARTFVISFGHAWRT